MKHEYKEFNSCACKCGNISCRKIRIHSFNHLVTENDQFVFSTLHHKSFQVLDTKTIIVDKCCGNCLNFHCSKCLEQFSIIKLQKFKQKFILGFNSDCLTYFKPKNLNKIVVIPEFPIALRSFVYLADQNKAENTKCNENSLICSNFSSKSFENDIDDEIFYFDSDEDVMFGTCQTDVIIGKYNESSIHPFQKSFRYFNL
ncbi:hypothetical protein M9Y10_038445 [Tritrichomonas musculus]|uniref:Uncharacterized protein n=1 Tax=Tritrichomonas musculus TaxID=1915356 RepID=A0ABR2KBL8_9EUKA